MTKTQEIIEQLNFLLIRAIEGYEHGKQDLDKDIMNIDAYERAFKFNFQQNILSNLVLKICKAEDSCLDILKYEKDKLITHLLDNIPGKWSSNYKPEYVWQNEVRSGLIYKLDDLITFFTTETKEL